MRSEVPVAVVPALPVAISVPSSRRDEDAPLHHVILAVVNELGDFAEFLFCGGVRSDAVEIETGLRILEANEALAVLLDQAFLGRGDVLARDAFAVLNRIGNEMAHAQEAQTGTALGEDATWQRTGPLTAADHAHSIGIGATLVRPRRHGRLVSTEPR